MPPKKIEQGSLSNWVTLMPTLAAVKQNVDPHLTGDDKIITAILHSSVMEKLIIVTIALFFWQYHEVKTAKVDTCITRIR